ncbi:MAG: response regulator [Planctomycetaceae bacterium]|nr:response regulator [Planctomycetaceae bacterium]
MLHDEIGETFLVVDDDELLRGRLARALHVRGYRPLVAGNFDEAMDVLALEQPHYAVVDLNMPGRSGLELLAEIQRKSPKTRCVMLTGYGSITTAVEAMRAGAWNYVTKPADAEQILAAFQDSPERGGRSVEIQYKPQTLAETEWDHIHRVLADCGDNISEAARQLGIPRRTLQRKLKKRAP